MENNKMIFFLILIANIMEMAKPLEFSDIPEDIKRLIIPISPYGLALACRQNWTIFKQVCYVVIDDEILDSDKIPYIVNLSITASKKITGPGIKYIRMYSSSYMRQINFDENQVIMVNFYGTQDAVSIFYCMNLHPDVKFRCGKIIVRNNFSEEKMLLLSFDQETINMISKIRPTCSYIVVKKGKIKVVVDQSRVRQGLSYLSTLVESMSVVCYSFEGIQCLYKTIEEVEWGIRSTLKTITIVNGRLKKMEKIFL